MLLLRIRQSPNSIEGPRHAPKEFESRTDVFDERQNVGGEREIVAGWIMSKRTRLREIGGDEVRLQQ